MAPSRLTLSLPLAQVREACQRLPQGGAAMYQIATCGGCRAKMINDDSNVVLSRVTCGKCGHVTNLEVSGSGYSVVMPFQGAEMSKQYVITIETDLSDSDLKEFLLNTGTAFFKFDVKNVELYVPSSYGGYGTRKIK